MTMQLTCLGGAAAWPNPGQGCSSFLVETGDTSILVDAGPNTLLELRKHIRYSTVTAIVISHLHADHILDLVPYRYGLVYGPERPERPIPLWLPPGGIQHLNRLAAALGSDAEQPVEFWTTVFDPTEYNPVDELVIGAVTISFERTEHAVECYAMRFRGQGQTSLTYTADTGSVAGLAAFARNSDLLVAEGTLPESDNADTGAGHLTPSQAGSLAALVGTPRLVISHLWAERPDEEVVKAARLTYSGDILIAKPGLVIDV
jgi:ribonuclease BN (tRNA processing enzyme)